MIAPAGRALLLAAIVLATGLSARATVAQDRQGIERAYQDLVRSVVRIEARYASIFEPAGVGSGVVISDDGLIAMADHVIDGAAEIWVVGPGGAPQRAAISRRAPERDLALIRIDAATLIPMKRRGRPVQASECVLALGNVMNWGIGIFAWVVSLATCTEGCPADTARGILTDITTPPGLSGGALVACDGRSLVGIISFGLLALNSTAPAAGIVGAVRASELAELLTDEVVCVWEDRLYC